jgi:hypothetical protein
MPHVSLVINLGIIAFILGGMLDAMYRIWNLGENSKSAFPNQRMFYLLIGTYFAYFIGQTVLSAEKLVLHIRDGDIISSQAMNKLVPARFFMFSLEFISEVVLISTMSAILNSDKTETKKKNSYHLMKEYDKDRPAQVYSTNVVSDDTISNPTSIDYLPLLD